MICRARMCDATCDLVEDDSSFDSGVFREAQHEGLGVRDVLWTVGGDEHAQLLGGLARLHVWHRYGRGGGGEVGGSWLRGRSGHGVMRCRRIRT